LEEGHILVRRLPKNISCEDDCELESRDMAIYGIPYIPYMVYLVFITIFSGSKHQNSINFGCDNKTFQLYYAIEIEIPTFLGLR
jgi:hypothetical protein